MHCILTICASICVLKKEDSVVKLPAWLKPDFYFIFLFNHQLHATKIKDVFFFPFTHGSRSFTCSFSFSTNLQTETEDSDILGLTSVKQSMNEIKMNKSVRKHTKVFIVDLIDPLSTAVLVISTDNTEFVI